MMRLSQAAKKLNVGTITVIEILSSKGHRIDNNPNAKLSFDQLEVLSKELNAPELLGDDFGSKAVETEKVQLPSEDTDIRYFREEPAQPEKIKIEHNLQGPTILGKIDLESKSAPVIVPVEETPAPPVVEIVEKEAPVLEKEPEKIPEVIVEPEKPVVIEEPVKIEEPVIEEVITKEPEVVVEKVVAEPEKEVIKEEVKAEIPKPEVVEPVKKVEEAPVQPPIVEQLVAKKEEVKKVVEEVVPPKLIKAQGDKLQGLKVLGKIELPVEKKPLTKEELKQKRKRKRVIVGEKVADTTRPNFDHQNRDKREGGTTPANNQGQGNQQQGQSQQNANKPKQDDSRGGRKDEKGKERRDVVSAEDVRGNIKSTISKMHSKGPDFGSKYRKEKRRNRAEQQDALDQQELEQSGILKVTEYISASELASLMDVSVNEVIGTCMKMGIFASINQRLDAETIQMVALEHNFEVEFISAEDEEVIESLEEADNEEDLSPRAPIVTIMGHVDHGKTSLLDYIRRSKVASGEAGGITQHIGAYSVKMKEGANKGKSITFLDTPGHEAFTAMRARGAKVTDVVIIVISADDSVMPQTKEAINHAQNAGVPIVFALNKIDKPGANPAKIREDLSKENILVESWGGKYQEQEVSAKSGIGIDELLDKVLLEAEMLDLKANANRKAFGTVIEASLDKGRGYVSTILVQNGTLKVGDIMLAGQYFGRVRAMVNDLGERIQSAGPSEPVQILGLPGAPQAGDKFNIMETDREAREIANKREQLNREMSIRAKKHSTLDEIGRRKAIGTFKELNVIVKGDVDGSVEALADSLLKLSTDEVVVNIVHKAVGQISESDVTLASAADAIVIGFQVRPSNNARRIADNEQI